MFEALTAKHSKPVKISEHGMTVTIIWGLLSGGFGAHCKHCHLDFYSKFLEREG